MESVDWLRAQIDWRETIAQQWLTADAEADRLFVGHCSPNWTLREVTADRQILDLHQPEPGQHPDFCGHDLHQLPCPTIRAIALPYADRDGYAEHFGGEGQAPTSA